MTYTSLEALHSPHTDHHAALFDQLSKLRTMLYMLQADGFEHFRRMDEMQQAQYLWTCLEFADGAFNALREADLVAG